ncbi:MAG TPA: hypothetical protein PKY96_15550 [Flavobacteriales bacterium]|nr:hypothetical protein [Flavobacteriales bacterium]
MLRIREMEQEEFTPAHGTVAFNKMLRVMMLQGRQACELRNPTRRPHAQEHMDDDHGCSNLPHFGHESKLSAKAGT